MTDRLLHAMHANHVVARARVGAIGPASAVARVGAWDLVDTGRPDFAVANGASVVDTATADDLPAAIDWFESRAVTPAFMLRDDVDAHLVSALEERGYIASTRTQPALLLRDPRPPRYDGALHVSEVSEEADVARYGPVNWPPEQRDIGMAIAQAAKSLGFAMLLGTLDGEPIACSMAAVTGSLVGVYNVAVEAPFRRRRFGEAMTWAAVAAGLRRGAANAWLGATPMSRRMYERIGFQPQYTYVQLAPRGA